MIDSNYIKLAKQITNHSLKLRKNDRVLIETIDAPEDFLITLIRQIRSLGAIPLIETRSSIVMREWLRELSDIQAKLQREFELNRIRKMDAYVAIRATRNANEYADVDGKIMAMYQRIMKPVTDIRVNKTRWVVLRWPTPSMAQSANMSTEAFEEFFFRVCCLNYDKMAKCMDSLIQLMKKTHEVRIVGPGTDLRFSIKGMKAIPCYGLRNLPDGEVFTAPIKNSVNGVIQFNTPTIYAGKKFENIRLVFKNGRVVEASCNNSPALITILNTDHGARYTGEFSFGLNPYILHPICDILFDEKISGSIHIALGQSYEACDNGNRSAIHWDMILIQRAEYGGGEIYFDGKLIRKDGLFVLPSLKGLNPENLTHPDLLNKVS